MQIFKHAFNVKCSQEKAWNFYTNTKHLEVVTPKKMNLKVISAENSIFKEGQEILIEAKISLIKNKWHSKITSMKQFEYTDEMLKGPFNRWKHNHKFQKINEKETKIIDEIDFELPYGIIGKLFKVYAFKQLDKIFEYRKMATITMLENK